MEQLVDWISGHEGSAPELVVHIGAGTGAAVSRWLALPAGRRPARLVLIEGDPEAAESLKREAAALPWMRVLSTAVAPAAGRLAWHRFSLPAVNGPLDGSGLEVYYPRLRRLSSATVDAMALADLLPTLLPGPAMHDAPVVLAFDVPGQEAALLESLPDELLYRCSAVIVRGCKAAPGPGGVPLDGTVAALGTRLFALTHTEHEREPLWPLAWLSFDRNAFEVQRLRAALAEHETQITELAASRDWHSRVGKESEARVEALTSERVGLQERQRELAAQMEALKGAAGRAEEQLRRADGLMHELESAREEAAKLKLLGEEAQKSAAEFKRSLVAARTQVAMKQRRIDELEAQLQQLRRSQGSLDDEIARAEGQIDLIKDLLLLTPQTHAA